MGTTPRRPCCSSPAWPSPSPWPPRPAARNRIGRAWTVGLLGVLLSADAAVPLILIGSFPSTGNPWHWGYSPLWLLSTITGSSFGLPHPNFWDIFVLRDEVVIDLPLFFTFSGFALGTLIGARRPAAAAVVPATVLTDRAESA